MKKIIILFLLVSVTVLSLPVVISNNKSAVAVVTHNIKKQDSNIVLLDTKTDKKTRLDLKKYLFCVVASEMPALYDEEALKAQTVAAYTYTLYKIEQNKGKSYDITADSVADQSYADLEDILDRWGENKNEYKERIEKAINSVYGLALTYNGEPILAVYHAVSSGKTNTAKSVWGGDYPYLKSIDSSWDALSGGYREEKVFSAEEFCEKLKDEVEFSGEAANYISAKEQQSNKYVNTITICKKQLKGAKIRSLFGLRSTCFDIDFDGQNFKFTTYGYGHNVGMSQYGADYMAKQGSSYKEILSHYYKGAKLKRIKS